MEPADIPEATEEKCSSNESGWTMYIASPWHELDLKGDDNNYTENYQVSEVKGKKDVYGGSKDSGDNNGDSDDSLASDACSGKAAGNKKSSAAKNLHQKGEGKECGKNVNVGREEALRGNKSSHGRHSRAFLLKK